jgi:DNA-binding transcriptional MocR family regulator
VMGAIRAKLASRVLTSGEKLPSIRSFAATMQVSPSTVVEAYDRLAAEGVIRARPGSGFYVSGAVPPLALAEAEPRQDRAVDPFWVSASRSTRTRDAEAPAAAGSHPIGCERGFASCSPTPCQSRRCAPDGLRPARAVALPCAASSFESSRKKE